MDEDAQQVEPNPTTVIGPDIKIIGNLEATGDLKVEGRVEGDVRCRRFILGGGGAVKGNVVSEQARISGAIDGSIEAADLAIEAAGVVTGEATYGRLKVAIGGVIEGKMKRKCEAEQKPTLVDAEQVSDKQSQSVLSQAEKRGRSGLFGGVAPTTT